MQWKIIQFQQRELICIGKKKWYRNDKPRDDVLLKEANDFLVVHLFEQNFFRPPREVICSSQNVDVLPWLMGEDFPNDV